MDCARDMCMRRATSLNAKPRSCRCNSGRFVTKRLEQPRHAIAALRRTDQQRQDMAAAQFCCKIIKNPVTRRFNIGNQLLHQCVVIVRQPFEHGVTRVFFPRHFTCGHINYN